MRVMVTYLAQIKQAAGVSSEVVELAAPCPVRDFIIFLARRRSDALARLLLTADERLQPTLLVFLGDEQVLPDSMLSDGAELTLLSPIAGGSGW
jgi:molybdopterin converting factor small subunit